MVEYGEILGGPADLPYVAGEVDLAGRKILLVPFYSSEAEEWFAVADVGNRQLRRIRLVDVVAGLLVAPEAPKPDEDLLIPLADLVFNRMSFPNLVRPLNGLLDVVENCASILELYDQISPLYARGHPGAQQVVQTLVNQLMVVCRTLYDVLHGLSREACSTVKRPEDLSMPLMEPLPKRVSKLMLKDGKPWAADELTMKYRLPEPLAKFYCAQAPVFSFIRETRDRVVHRGRNAGEPGYVSSFDEGLAVSIEQPPWSDLEIWDEDSVVRGKFGSLRKVFAFLIAEVLGASTVFARAYLSCIALPQPISPDNHLFLRGPLNHHLMTLDEVTASPWERATRGGQDDGVPET